MTKSLLIIIVFFSSIIIQARTYTCTYINPQQIGFNVPLSETGATLEDAANNALNKCLSTICTTLQAQMQKAIAQLQMANSGEILALLQFTGQPKDTHQSTLNTIMNSSADDIKDTACTQPTYNQIIYMDTMCRTSPMECQ